MELKDCLCLPGTQCQKAPNRVHKPFKALDYGHQPGDWEQATKLANAAVEADDLEVDWCLDMTPVVRPKNW